MSAALLAQDLRPQFSRFLGSDPQRLHFAAHSHHPWPDLSLDAQIRCWLDAARHIDGKWVPVLEEWLPRAQAHIARQLGLPDPTSLCFAPNTHELVLRLRSCLPLHRPLRLLTSDSEFHSFARQLARWEEAGEVHATRIAVADGRDFVERFGSAAAEGGWDLVYLSQCFFNSGLRLERLEELVAAVPDADTLIAIDGYHGFMAAPTDLGAIADRAFYLAGGYKYAMAGEGVCFMHCPPGHGKRPVNTGWYAGFDSLPEGPAQVGYAQDGRRFFGATFDPSGLYRFVAVQDWLRDADIGVEAIHAHALALQQLFLDGLPKDHALATARRLPAAELPRGNFLCFAFAEAPRWQRALAAAGIVTDCRGDRLRFGFGIYQGPEELAELLVRLRDLRPS